ncbi:unnamed protein product [Rotaria sp. Silwood1]|nr:unnamed protein product [Rotaria sp. Silwood1]
MLPSSDCKMIALPRTGTTDWWTDLWLNEGFVSWIEYLDVDKFYPEFDIWTQFIADTFASFLIPDALKSSHPIEVPIGHPTEIEEIFDESSYSKGSSIIRMLHDYIGDDAFRKGLHNYLKEYSYKKYNYASTMGNLSTLIEYTDYYNNLKNIV